MSWPWPGPGDIIKNMLYACSQLCIVYTRESALKAHLSSRKRFELVQQREVLRVVGEVVAFELIVLRERSTVPDDSARATAGRRVRREGHGGIGAVAYEENTTSVTRPGGSRTFL